MVSQEFAHPTGAFPILNPMGKVFKIALSNYIWLEEFHPAWNRKDNILIVSNGKKEFIEEILKRLLNFLNLERTVLLYNEEIDLKINRYSLSPNYGKDLNNRRWNIILFITEDENSIHHRNSLYYISKAFHFKRAYLIESNNILLDITRHFKFFLKGNKYNTFAYVEPDTWKYLYNLANDLSDECTILEIGTYIGGTTIALALACKEREKGRVVTVDPSLPKCFYDNISFYCLNDYIIPFEMFSMDLYKLWEEKCDEYGLKKNISILFLDGSHDYESVLFDLFAWNKFMLFNSKIVIHDYYHPIQTGVSKATYKFLSENKNIKIIKKFKDCIVCSKTE